MTKDEALKLALEALEKAKRQCHHHKIAPHLIYDEAIAAIKEALAEPVPESSACCHACFKASGAILMTRMILCPTCGNKRCPRASDHRLECTDINEPGQTGSVYTALLPVQPAQRQWVGLTEEEINACDPSEECWGLHKIALSIEAKLKAKNT
jgi:hypothetical protein